MIMKEVEAIVFDMDGILFDTERLLTDCWIKTAEEFGLKNIQPLLNKCMGLNYADTRRVFQEMYGPKFAYDAWKEAISEKFYDIIEKEGIPIKIGAIELLEHLKNKKYKIGLASSTRSSSVYSHLERTHMQNYFQVILCGDMVEHSKPDPEIYIQAVKKLGVKPQNAAAIEDSPNGLRSAHNAGLKTIMIPDLVPSSDELREYITAEYTSLLELISIF